MFCYNLSMDTQNKHNQVSLIEFPANTPEELKVTTDFYTAVFDWQYKDWGGVYSDTPDSGMMTGVNAAEQGRPTMPLTVIYVTDLAEKQDMIRKAGGKITLDTYEFPGGKRFHFMDPAGNELAVWSE